MEKIYIYLIEKNFSPEKEEVIRKCALSFSEKAFISFDKSTPLLRTDKGKPYFYKNPFYFSVSHSKNLFAVAFSKKPLGIDLQDHRNCNQNKIANRYFHKDELLSFKNGEDFFKIWTAKESHVKFLGTGIDKNFSKFSVFDNYKNFKFINSIKNHTLCVYSENETELFLEEINF